MNMKNAAINDDRGVECRSEGARYIRGSPFSFTEMVGPGGALIWTWCTCPRYV